LKEVDVKENIHIHILAILVMLFLLNPSIIAIFLRSIFLRKS